MKRLYIFFVAFLLVSLSRAWAQSEAAVLLQSQRGEVFQLAIGGRLINPVASNRVAVGDLPAGRHLLDIRVIMGGFRAQRIRAEVALRDGYESVFSLVPARRARTLLLQKVEEVPLYNVASPVPNPPAEEICRYNMNEEDIARTVRFMREESFDDRRLEIAKGEIKLAGGIMSNDLLILLQEIKFDNRRVELAKFAFTYVCDQHRFSRVFDAFEFEINRREMQDFLYNR